MILKITYTKSLINHEWTDRIVIGQDIHTAHRLLMKGGHGFGHLLRVVKGVAFNFETHICFSSKTPTTI